MMNAHSLETYRSLLLFGLEALKAMLLLNGGAIVAILAYLGQAQTRADLAPMAKMPLGLFSVGIVCTMLAFTFGYLTQHALFNEEQDRPRGVAHTTWQWSAFSAGVASLGFFLAGAYAAISVLAG